MSVLQLHLLGPGELSLEGRPVRLHSERTLALLAFLALESDRPHTRARLAALLWGDLGEGAARQNLRQALYSLRGVAEGRLGAALQADHDLVRLVPEAPLQVDVLRFLDAVGGTDEAQWTVAALLYRAPLLDGRDFDRCAEYQAWLDTARDRLHARAVQNLDRLAIGGMARAAWDGALQWAEAMRSLEPASESASQHLLRIHAARGRPDAVDAEWARLSGLLQRELGIRPTADTARLYRTLRREASDFPATERAPDPAVTPAGAGLPAMAGDTESILRAARAAERVYAFGHAVDLYERALRLMERAEGAAPQRRCDVLLSEATALERLGRRAEQSAALDQALAIARGCGDPERAAVILLQRASAEAYVGHHAAAQRAAEEALATFTTMGDLPGQAEALRELGFVHWHAQDYAAALQRARDALALHRHIGDVAGEATALHNMAEIHRGLGSPRQAADGFEQAMRLHWAAGHREGEILSLFGWAQALQQEGDAPGAQRKLEAALELSERHGERTMQARALHALAMHHLALGQTEAALASIRRAIEVDRSTGYAHALGHDLVDFAGLHLLRGEVGQARLALEEALVWFALTQDADALASTRERLHDLDAGRAASILPAGPRRGVKSHLPLGEGKVYCEFESPLAVRARL